MPFIEVNGARLYYESYGEDRPGRVPIILIHGSTNTGSYEWSEITPLLAREYRVIVPDCRGHGQSSNPNLSYSFKELAADTAGLVRALGYERAHIVGHSNGGNVALVTLLEHPDVVQTCIPQAANAYVSPDLVEKEPPLFDPDRVAQKSPDWMNEMIALHGPTHGSDYWRDLLRLTVQEIITEPNYTPQNLAGVTRPTLVIQGEKDGVNAPARHAQFIAQYVPNAELWIPKNTAHNVHKELPCEWIARILDFLARRGDDANEALYRLQQARYADDRETVFAMRAAILPGPSRAGGEGDISLTGQVLTKEQHQAALAVLPIQPAKDEVRVLLEDAPWALFNRSVADVRREPNARSEQVSQALVGEAARVLEKRQEWVRVLLVRDGYLGWTREAALRACSKEEASAYQATCNALVIAELAQAALVPAGRRDEIVGKLPFGTTLPVVERRDGLAAVRLPDGHVWWVAESDLLPFARRPKPDEAGIAFTLSLIRRFVGVPYLWGGRSPFGYDCSGLAQTFFGFMGVVIPRDADQQYRAGRLVEGSPRPADLLFFGDSSDTTETVRLGRITHVAISLGGDEMIHANGGTWSVSYNSLDPASPIYRADLQRDLAGVRRFV